MENSHDHTISTWDITTIITYIRNHYIQLFLLLIVFIIVYIIDHITNINAMIYGSPQIIPGLPNPSSSNQNPLLKNPLLKKVEQKQRKKRK
jgi:hypothetical protein